MEEVGFTLRPELLLGPTTPLPMHGLVPRDILGAAWWKKTRTDAMIKSYYCCHICGVPKAKAKFKKWLEGHELYDVDYVAGRWEYTETVALCHCCHNFVHLGRLRSLLEHRKITAKRYKAIIDHGESVLRKNDMLQCSRVQPTNGVASWEKWKLILNGKEYPSLYTGLEDWKQRYLAGV